MDKLGWFFRQRVQNAEMKDAFNKAEIADRDIVADIISPSTGVLMSAVSVTEDSPQSQEVIVGASTGYDKDGKRIFDAGQNFDFTGDDDPANPRIARLYVKFDEKKSNPRVDGAGNTVQFDCDEGVILERDLGTPAGSPTPPALRVDESILLADITIPAAGGNITNSEIDTSGQPLQSAFPFERIEGSSKDLEDALLGAKTAGAAAGDRVAIISDIPTTTTPEGYLGEIKMLNERGANFGTEFQVEFARCADRTNVKLLQMDSSLGGLGISIADGTVNLAPNSSGKFPASPALGTAPAAGEWHVFLVGDSGAGGGNADRVMLVHLNGGEGAPGGSSLVAGMAGTGYDLYRRIGSIMADASGNLFPVRVINRETIYENLHSAATGAGGAKTPVSLATWVPRTAERAIIHALAAFNITGNELRIYDGAQVVVPFPDYTARLRGILQNLDHYGYANNRIQLHVDSTQQIFWDTSGVAVFSTEIQVAGFVADLKHV